MTNETAQASQHNNEPMVNEPQGVCTCPGCAKDLSVPESVTRVYTDASIDLESLSFDDDVEDRGHYQDGNLFVSDVYEKELPIHLEYDELVHEYDLCAACGVTLVKTNS